MKTCHISINNTLCITVNKFEGNLKHYNNFNCPSKDRITLPLKQPILARAPWLIFVYFNCNDDNKPYCMPFVEIKSENLDIGQQDQQLNMALTLAGSHWDYVLAKYIQTTYCYSS